MESLLEGSGIVANTKVTAVSQAAKIHTQRQCTQNRFILAFGAYDIGSRKLKKTILSIAIDCCRQHRLC